MRGFWCMVFAIFFISSFPPPTFRWLLHLDKVAFQSLEWRSMLCTLQLQVHGAPCNIYHTFSFENNQRFKQIQKHDSNPQPQPTVRTAAQLPLEHHHPRTAEQAELPPQIAIRAAVLFQNSPMSVAPIVTLPLHHP